MNQWISRYKRIFDFGKAVSGFLGLSVFVMIVAPWKGTIFGYGPHCIEKAEYLQAVAKFYGIILGLIAGVMLIVFVLSTTFGLLFRWLPQKPEGYTYIDYLLSMGLLLLSASVALTIMSVVVYQN